MVRQNLHSSAHGQRIQGGASSSQSPEQQLRRAIFAAGRRKCPSAEEALVVAELVTKVQPEKIAALAVEGSEHIKLRRASLLLVREMARHKATRALVAETLARVIHTPDDLIDFVALYWNDGRVPLSSQVKKGLAAAFPKFDESQLAKSKPGGPIKLRDVLFLSHAKPRDQTQAAVWKKLIWGRLG